MFFFIISTVSLLILLSKSLTLRPLPSSATHISLLSFFFLKDFFFFPVFSFTNCTSNGAEDMRASKKKCTSPAKKVEDSTHTSVLDLPDLALESILGRLSAAGLCSMAGVCGSLRDLCWSDYLWERHMREKWGKVIGTVTQREWQRCLASRRDGLSAAASAKPKALLFGSLTCFWPLPWPRLRHDVSSKLNSSLPPDSIASWYLSLESGEFWFPAQVYNREHEHAGFLLSCYDAELSYDCKRDTFNARYPPHGRRTIVTEEAVEWGRIRAPPIETPAHDLHISICIEELRPGDHIEIQWRRSKEFPYGWWYGVVGHSEACDQNEHFCHCQNSEKVVVEFNQYTPGSRWRRALINRKSHREEGNETDGFYGGVRKLCNEDEISTWRRLWPRDVLE